MTKKRGGGITQVIQIIRGLRRHLFLEVVMGLDFLLVRQQTTNFSELNKSKQVQTKVKFLAKDR